MHTIVLGELEVTYQPDSEPALLIHHLSRGYDLATLSVEATAELGRLLAVSQKRIRELDGGYRVILGAGGDCSLYRPDGQRVCYFNPDQAARLAHLIQAAGGGR